MYLKDGDVGNPPSERDRQTEGETVFAKIFSNASRFALKVFSNIFKCIKISTQNMSIAFFIARVASTK